MQFDIITLDEYFFDQIFTGLPKFPALGQETYSKKLTTTGGAMFITATAFTRLGAKVGWPATFGDDSYSQFVYELSQKEGIDLSLARVLDRPNRRVTSSMPFEGERAFVTFVDDEPSDLDAYYLSALQRATYRHVHFGGFVCRKRLTPFLDVIRQKGATVSMDCQDGDHLSDPAKCIDALELVDVFMPNAREAQILSGCSDTLEAVKLLAEKTPLLVVKNGADGVIVAQQDEIIQVAGLNAGEVIDTTGAGDCFNAGFLYAHVIEQHPHEISAKYGNICGGLSVTGIGGATNAPTYSELQGWLEKLPAL